MTIAAFIRNAQTWRSVVYYEKEGRV